MPRMTDIGKPWMPVRLSLPLERFVEIGFLKTSYFRSENTEREYAMEAMEIPC